VSSLRMLGLCGSGSEGDSVVVRAPKPFQVSVGYLFDESRPVEWLWFLVRGSARPAGEAALDRRGWGLQHGSASRVSL
jgi:hypothetical protein